MLAGGVTLGALAIGIGLSLAGHRILFYGKTLVAKQRADSLSQRLAGGRSIVLYLRSMLDDVMTAKTPAAFHYRGEEIRGLSTEEEHLARAVRDLGELTAIDPPKPRPSVGATRYEAEWEEWREAALVLMYRAKLVMIRAGDGQWLWWEMMEAWKLVPRERLVLLIPRMPHNGNDSARASKHGAPCRFPNFPATAPIVRVSSESCSSRATARRAPYL